MTYEELIVFITDLKKQHKKVYSNVYTAFNNDADVVYRDSDLIVFTLSEVDSKVKRAFFCSGSMEKLPAALSMCDDDSTIEIIFRKNDEFLNSLSKAGFAQIALMKKLINKDIELTLSEKTNITIASIDNYMLSTEDSEDVYNLLQDVFDDRISHLPSMEMIRECIKNGNMLAVKKDCKIVSLLQTVVEPKSYYINQIINQGDKAEFYRMFFSSLHQYAIGGGRYAYAWVADNNYASLRFFEKCGFSEGNMYISVYSKKNP